MPKLPNRPSSATRKAAFKNTRNNFVRNNTAVQRTYGLNKQYDDQTKYRNKGQDFENDTANSQDWKSYVDKYDMGGYMTGGGDAYGSAEGASYGGDWQQYEDRFQWGLNQEGAPLTPDAARAAEIQNQSYDQTPQNRDRQVSRQNSQQNPNMHSAKANGGMVPRYADGEERTKNIVAGVSIPLIALGGAYASGFRPGIFDLKGPNIKEHSFIDRLMQHKDQFPKMPDAAEVERATGRGQIGAGYGYDWDTNDPYYQYAEAALPDDAHIPNGERIVQYPSYDEEPELYKAADRSFAQITPIRENVQENVRVAHDNSERMTNLYHEHGPVRRAFSHIFPFGSVGNKRRAMQAAIAREEGVRQAGERSVNEAVNQHRTHMGIISQTLARNEELLANMARQRQQAANYKSTGTTTDVSRELDAPEIAQNQPMVSTLLPSSNQGNPANVSPDSAEQFPIVPQLNSQATRDQLLTQNIDPQFLQQSNLPANAPIESIRQLVAHNPQAAQSVQQNLDNELFNDTSDIPPGSPDDVTRIPISRRGEQQDEYYSRRPTLKRPNNLVGYHVPATELPGDYNLGIDLGMPTEGQNPATIPPIMAQRMRAFTPPQTDLNFGSDENELLGNFGRLREGLIPPSTVRPEGAQMNFPILGSMRPGYGVFESGEIPTLGRENPVSNNPVYIVPGSNSTTQSTFQPSVQPGPGNARPPQQTENPVTEVKRIPIKKKLAQHGNSSDLSEGGDIVAKAKKKPFNTSIKPLWMTDTAWEHATNPTTRKSYKFPKGPDGKHVGKIYRRDVDSEFFTKNNQIVANPETEKQVFQFAKEHPEVKVERSTYSKFTGGTKGNPTKETKVPIFRIHPDDDIAQALHHINHIPWEQSKLAEGGRVMRYDDGGDDVAKGLIAGGAALGGIGLLAGGAYGSGVRYSPGGATGIEGQNATRGLYLQNGSLLNNQTLGQSASNALTGNASSGDLRNLQSTYSKVLNSGAGRAVGLNNNPRSVNLNQLQNRNSGGQYLQQPDVQNRNTPEQMFPDQPGQQYTMDDTFRNINETRRGVVGSMAGANAEGIHPTSDFHQQRMLDNLERLRREQQGFTLVPQYIQHNNGGSVRRYDDGGDNDYATPLLATAGAIGGAGVLAGATAAGLHGAGLSYMNSQDIANADPMGLIRGYEVSPGRFQDGPTPGFYRRAGSLMGPSIQDAQSAQRSHQASPQYAQRSGIKKAPLNAEGLRRYVADQPKIYGGQLEVTPRVFEFKKNQYASEARDPRLVYKQFSPTAEIPTIIPPLPGATGDGPRAYNPETDPDRGPVQTRAPQHVERPLQEYSGTNQTAAPLTEYAPPLGYVNYNRLEPGSRANNIPPDPLKVEIDQRGTDYPIINTADHPMVGLPPYQYNTMSAVRNGNMNGYYMDPSLTDRTDAERYGGRYEDGGYVQRYDDGGEIQRYAFGGYSKEVNGQMDQARQQMMQQQQQQQMQGGDPNQQMQQQQPQQDPNMGMPGAPPQQMEQPQPQPEQPQEQPIKLQSGVVDVTGMLGPTQQPQQGGQPPMGQPQAGDVQAMSNLPYYQNQYAKMAQHAADPKRTLYRANKGTKFQTA